jgi:hypothetical protein
MKHTHPIIVLLMSFFLVAAQAMAGNSDLEIHCVPKRIDQNMKKASDGGANVAKEHWAYDVSIENKTFKELTNLDVRYVLFLTREQLGVKAAPTPEREKGSFSIDILKPHEKKTLTTNSVELSKSNLVGNWIYPSGAKPNAQDSLVGVAIRVYQAGQSFADFANPSNLAREKWE